MKSSAPALPSLLLALLALAGLAPAPARAQIEIAPHESLPFDRPESWAMKYFGSVALMTGFGAGRELQPGALELGLEGAWVPSLSAEERTVGFIGTKEEDLNRTSVFGRVRLAVGLPGRFRLTAGLVPPIEVEGVKPRFLALGIEHPLAEGNRWRLGLGLTGQAGTIRGDLTCSRAAVAAGDDPARNPYRCLKPSDDEMTVRSASLELTGSLLPAGASGLEPYAALAAHYFDEDFQVRASYGTVIDRSRLATDGTTYSATLGLALPVGERLRLAGELFYSPLDVVRDAARGSQDDALFNARVLLGYRLR